MATPAASAPAPAPAPEAPAAPISRRLKEAEARIGSDKWDVDAWIALLHEAGSRPFSTADELYTRLVAQFPPTARFWRARAEHCARDAAAAPAPAPAAGGDDVVPLGAVLGDGASDAATNGSTGTATAAGGAETDAAEVTPSTTPQVDRVVAIYEAGVKDAPTSVELWRAYIAYALARAAPGTENAVVPIFERAANAAGLDLHATPLWQDYIDFLKTRASLSDSQRRDALRRVYQRSVMTLFTSGHIFARGGRFGKPVNLWKDANAIVPRFFCLLSFVSPTDSSVYNINHPAFLLVHASSPSAMLRQENLLHPNVPPSPETPSLEPPSLLFRNTN